MLLCNAQSETFQQKSAMFVSSSCLETCIASKQPHPGDDTAIGSSQTCTWKLDMNFDDTAFAHTLKDYSVFGFVPRLTFRNETKGLDVVVQT